MNEYKLESQIEEKGKQAVLNDNELFWQFIMEQDDWHIRAPGIIAELMEAYNNDWCDYVEERYSRVAEAVADRVADMLAEKNDDDSATAALYDN